MNSDGAREGNSKSLPTATVFHTKTLEKSFLDDLLIFSELHDPMHICMYHHEGLSFGS